MVPVRILRALTRMVALPRPWLVMLVLKHFIQDAIQIKSHAFS